MEKIMLIQRLLQQEKCPWIIYNVSNEQITISIARIVGNVEIVNSSNVRDRVICSRITDDSFKWKLIETAG